VSERASRADRLAATLDDFIRSSPDVEAAAVVSFDGLPMASALPEELEEDRLGAMSAALLSLGEQAAMGLGRGLLNQVFVEGEHGFVFLMSARDQAVLTAVAGRSAKIGFMLFEMRRAADRIGLALADEDPLVVAPEAAPAPVPAAAPETVAAPEAIPATEVDPAPAVLASVPAATNGHRHDDLHYPAPVGAPTSLPGPEAAYGAVAPIADPAGQA
jgi:predicted regulator of Ras-like GTPase activity (Roadblock/LC7/MglB family)